MTPSKMAVNLAVTVHPSSYNRHTASPDHVFTEAANLTGDKWQSW